MQLRGRMPPYVAFSLNEDSSLLSLYFPLFEPGDHSSSLSRLLTASLHEFTNNHLTSIHYVFSSTCLFTSSNLCAPCHCYNNNNNNNNNNINYNNYCSWIARRRRSLGGTSGGSAVVFAANGSVLRGRRPASVVRGVSRLSERI